MLKELKELAGKKDYSKLKGYRILKFWHPESDKNPEYFCFCDTLEQAQEICRRKESSFKEGDESNWWFLGYTDASSRSSDITLW